MLHLLHRPKSWTAFLGNVKAVKTAQGLVRNRKANERPLALWIDGPSGTGKTTLAELVAGDLIGDPGCLEAWDGAGFDQATARELERNIQYSSLFGGGWRCFIVNEAHAMTPGAVQALLTILESMPARRAIVFTTTQGRNANIFGDFDGPLKSRCVPISLTSQGLADAFAARALEIAASENMGGIDLRKAKRIVQEEKNNLRWVIARIEAGDFMIDDPESDSLSLVA